MTLEEYTQAGGKDTFTYWLEKRLEELGSIWGGSAFKFGIYQMDPNRRREYKPDTKHKSDGEYAWYSKYGNTRQEAFNNTKQLILRVIQATQGARLEDIGAMELGRAVKWKIASLYQDRKEFPITPIFDKDALRFIVGNTEKRVSTLELMQQVRKLRGQADFWDFYDRSWKKWIESEEARKKMAAPGDKDDEDEDGEDDALRAGRTARYWLYAPGDGGRYWEDFYSQGIMAIGWDDLGDLKQYPSKEAIAQELREQDNEPDSSKKNNANSCFAFGHEMKPGDIIFAKIGRERVVGRGVVTSDYMFDSLRPSFKHVRHVDWKAKGIWTDPEGFAIKTVTEVTRPDFIKRLLTLTGGVLSMTEANQDELGSDMPDIGQPTNLILYGPPGTGKTYYLRDQLIPLYVSGHLK